MKNPMRRPYFFLNAFIPLMILAAHAAAATNKHPPADTIELYLFEALCAGQEIYGLTPEQDTTLRLFCPGAAAAPDTMKTIEVDVLPLPDFQITGDSILCTGEPGELEVEGFFAAYEWSTGETGRSIQVSEPGPYSVTATSGNGCRGQRSVGVAASAPDIVLEIQDPSCPGIQDGAIRILQFFGGLAPYEISIDGGPYRPDTAFAGLLPGSYFLRWKDAAGCRDSTAATLAEPAGFSIELGPDTTLYPGDSLQLTAQVSGQAQSWQWSPPQLFDCDTCANPVVVRPENATITLLATNAKGCMATDSRRIFVEKSFRLFVPNAFAPYNGNANTSLRVFPGPGNWQLASFEVYNRWGSPRFRSKTPVQYPAYLEWDGRANGELVPPGLYVWVAELALPNGRKEIRSGSVSILR